ncbi:MAG: DUF4127 family protein [Deinococcales bacterium]
MKSVLLLPCDTRPPTLELPLQLAQVAGVTIQHPPLEILNQINQPGDTKKIAAWLLEKASSADAAIITLETLCLGGMIPARRVTDSLEDALLRLELLCELKRCYPNLKIYAYGVIVRVAHDNDPLEEKPYYGQYGTALRKVSEWTDRVERGANAEELERAKAALPPAILADWLGTRERNHALHRRALELLAEGVLEHLCLTLDDTTPYGLAARDRRRLEARIDELELWERTDIYPGADEVAAALLARAIAQAHGRKPSVFVRYPSVLSEQSIMLYEDRILGELVKAHIRAAGGVPAARASSADLILAVNAPSTKQAHRAPDFELVDTANRNLPAFVDQICDDMANNRAVTVADVAYANGAEPRFVQQLLARVDLTRLAGFAAWNTAGNTLGSAIAAGICALHGQDKMALATANFSRLVDDYLYQSIVRHQVWQALPKPDPFDLGEQKALAEAEMESRVRTMAEQLFDTHFAPKLNAKLEWGGSSLAWNRLFTGVFKFRLMS